MKLRKHWVWLGMNTLILAVALSACGGGNKAGTSGSGSPSPSDASSASQQVTASPSSAPSASPSPSAQESGTVTYKAFNGDVEIPRNPKRVAVIANSYVGHFLALGLKPVGITEGAMLNEYFKGKLDGIENLGEGNNLEKLLALQPDLIITFSGAEDLEQLSKIAPTIVIEYGKMDTRQQLREFGKITNREKQAEEWIAAWDKKIADYKPKVQAAVGDKTVSILQPYAKGIYAFGHNYGRGGEIVYGEFKLKAPELIQKEAIDSGAGWANLSLEKLPEFAGDYMFTSAWSGDTADPENVYGTTIWKNLPAVKSGNVFMLDPNSSYYNDPVSLEAQLEFVVEKLTGGK